MCKKDFDAVIWFVFLSMWTMIICSIISFIDGDEVMFLICDIFAALIGICYFIFDLDNRLKKLE